MMIIGARNADTRRWVARSRCRRCDWQDLRKAGAEVDAIVLEPRRCRACGWRWRAALADAMESRRADVQQEAAHKLLGAQGHGFVARATLGAVVLRAEGGAPIIKCQESRVGDRHSMGVARQIGEHCLGSGEGVLGVDHPLALARRSEPVGERFGVGQIEVFAEELEFTVTMQALRRDRTRTERKNPGLHGTQRSVSGARPPPGTMPCTCG
jgi:hypothetical protein